MNTLFAYIKKTDDPILKLWVLLFAIFLAFSFILNEKVSLSIILASFLYVGYVVHKIHFLYSKPLGMPFFMFKFWCMSTPKFNTGYNDIYKYRHELKFTDANYGNWVNDICDRGWCGFLEAVVIRIKHSELTN